MSWLVVIGIIVLAIGGGTVLAGPSLTNGWPAAKARLYEREQQDLALAQSQPRAKQPSAGIAPTSQSPAPRHAGIVAMRQGPFPRSTFDVRDLWQGPVGSDWVLAYAGAEPDSPTGPLTRGALRLYTETADLHLTLVGTFPAVEGTGPLTVTSASGDLLQLRTDSGTSLSFDLQTRQYR